MEKGIKTIIFEFIMDCDIKTLKAISNDLSISLSTGIKGNITKGHRLIFINSLTESHIPEIERYMQIESV